MISGTCASVCVCGHLCRQRTWHCAQVDWVLCLLQAEITKMPGAHAMERLAKVDAELAAHKSTLQKHLALEAKVCTLAYPSTCLDEISQCLRPRCPCALPQLPYALPLFRRLAAVLLSNGL